jgi:class 3 adenylate cyclase
MSNMELRMQYATTSDAVRIAYGTTGGGPWVVRAPSLPFTHSQMEWEQGSEFFDQLAANFSVVQFDPRGTGLSDRDPVDLSMQARMLDLEAVVDRLRLDRFVLHAIGWSGPMCIRYVIDHPDRVSHLVLDDAQARVQDFMNIPQIRALDQLTGDWESFLDYLVFMLYGLSKAEAVAVKAYLRGCVTPEGARRIFDGLRHDDVTDLLSEVPVPTLIVQHTGMAQNVDTAREMAALIPDARLVLLDGMVTDETARIVRGIAELMGTEADFRDHTRAPQRHSVQSGVRTILFTDMVDHTVMMDRLGDRAGRDVLRDHERITRETLRAHGGDEVKTMGDGFMASFPSVAGAVECAIELQRAFNTREDEGKEPIRVRIGLNAGEPIEEGGDLFGATVIMASRIATHGEAGEILASDVVRALCAGKGFLFADRGENVLRGFEDPVRVYEVGWRQ